MSFIDWPDVLALEFPEAIKSWDFEFCPLALAGDGGMGSGGSAGSVGSVGKVFFFFFGDRGRISESQSLDSVSESSYFGFGLWKKKMTK